MIMSGSFCSLYREIHYIVTLLIVKGARICSLFHEIHYIKIRYIEVWVILGWFGRQLSGQLMIFPFVQYSLIHDVALNDIEYQFCFLYRFIEIA